MEKLTIQEEEAMLYIWELGSCFVKDIVAKFAKENNTDVKLGGFVCFKLGEGLQKKEEDFAAEVAAQLGKSA